MALSWTANAPAFSTNASTGTSNITFSGVDFGTAAADRIVYVNGVIAVSGSANAFDVTIGGVLGTITGAFEGIGATGRLSFGAWAKVPTGTSGTVVVNCSGTKLASPGHELVSWSLYGAANSGANFDLLSSTGTGARNQSITVPTGGVHLAAIFTATAAITFTWANGTESRDVANSPQGAVSTAEFSPGTGASHSISATPSASAPTLMFSTSWVELPPPTFTLAVTEARDTSAIAVQPAKMVALSVTEASDTSAIAVQQIIATSLAVTEGSDTAAVVADPIVAGSLVVTEAPDTFSAAVQVLWEVTLSVSETSDTASFLMLSDGFALNVTEAPDTFAAVIGQVHTVSLAASEAPDVFSATLIQVHTVTLGASEAPDTLSASVNGWIVVLEASEANDTFHATATLTLGVTCAILELSDGVFFQIDLNIWSPDSPAAGSWTPTVPPDNVWISVEGSSPNWAPIDDLDEFWIPIDEPPPWS